jgi:phytoene synthase
MGRLDRIYAGKPDADPVDRGFAQVVRDFAIPRAVPDLLLDGFRWDVQGRRYQSIEDTVGYGVRVASTVGVMMTLIMGRRDRYTLCRAAELGVAMQLTNIARDVGEDARNARVYLPGDWLTAAGVPEAALGAEPHFSPALGAVVAQLLAEAEGYYARANTGIGRLPWRCRAAIAAASHIYRRIGSVVAQREHDSVSSRAITGGGRKLWLAARALRYAVWAPGLDRSEPSAPVAVLIDAVAPRES